MPRKVKQRKARAWPDDPTTDPLYPFPGRPLRPAPPDSATADTLKPPRNQSTPVSWGELKRGYRRKDR